MVARERTKLTDAAIARLRPHEREYTVWDSHIAGLGGRVRPTGGRSWVLLLDAGGRTKRVSLGPVAVKSVEEARRECHARQAVGPQPGKTDAAADRVPLFRDFVAGPWKQVHFARYKPSGQDTASGCLRRQLLPAFGAKPLDRITPARIRQWFDRYSRTAPGSANRGLDILRQILNFAVACGHVEVNPAKGIRRNRRPALTRFLSREEIARLHSVLDAQTGKSGQQQADIVRLLLLTGCRKGEITGLRWSEVRDGVLALADSKTGPRTVPLGSRASAILDRQPRGGSPFVFPSPLDPARPRGPDFKLWYRIRREAGIEDVRIHDLRHTMASHAVMNGVPVPVVSRLLGHSNVQMTLRYAHLADRDIEAAAERIGKAMAQVMGLSLQMHPLDTSNGGLRRDNQLETCASIRMRRGKAAARNGGRA
ncbi:MAG: tyrosine-type recombinase/integrase [Alphaproteobacteria bacterium]|nr:tyrosine-type recombinase/integrase [Alphaproteobacteria bacterium]